MTPEELRAYHREYYHAHREEILARRKASAEAHPERQEAHRAQWYCHDTCRVLEEHKQALADDPERLSTDFILRLVQGENGKTGLLQKLPGFDVEKVTLKRPPETYICIEPYRKAYA